MVATAIAMVTVIVMAMGLAAAGTGTIIGGDTGMRTGVMKPMGGIATGTGRAIAAGMGKLTRRERKTDVEIRTERKTGSGTVTGGMTEIIKQRGKLRKVLRESGKRLEPECANETQKPIMTTT